MLFNQIMSRLEACQETGLAAQKTARTRFLEWAIMRNEDISPHTIRVVLSTPDALTAESDAAQAFVRCLHEALQPMHHKPLRRSRGNGRVLRLN